MFTLEITGLVATDAANTTLKLLSKSEFVAKKATIRYNTYDSSKNEFPLVIEGKLDNKPAIIKISGLACGFVGTITYATVHILMELGFNPSPDDIMTSNLASPDGWIILHLET